MGSGVRRAIGGLVTLALLVAAVGFYLASPRLAANAGPPPGNNADPAGSPSSEPSAASPQPATPVPTQTETTPGGESPRDRKLPPGPGGREPGIRITAIPTVQGPFEVVETLRLAEPVSALTLAPPDLTPATSSLPGTHPVADALRVTANGHPVRLPTRRVSRPIEVLPSGPTDLFELHYRLRGVTVLNTPSSAGRALGGLGPLVTGVPDELPVAITVRGHSVLNLSCPRLPIANQACAVGARPRMRVDRNLTRRDALVLVQFNIPATRVGAPE
jgi:hypothetical protein